VQGTVPKSRGKVAQLQVRQLQGLLGNNSQLCAKIPALCDGFVNVHALPSPS